MYSSKASVGVKGEAAVLLEVQHRMTSVTIFNGVSAKK